MVFSFHPFNVRIGVSSDRHTFGARPGHLAQRLSQPETILHGRFQLNADPEPQGKTFGESCEGQRIYTTGRRES
jgi:hypothetical protein